MSVGADADPQSLGQAAQPPHLLWPFAADSQLPQLAVERCAEALMLAPNYWYREPSVASGMRALRLTNRATLQSVDTYNKRLAIRGEHVPMLAQSVKSRGRFGGLRELTLLAQDAPSLGTAAASLADLTLLTSLQLEPDSDYPFSVDVPLLALAAPLVLLRQLRYITIDLWSAPSHAVAGMVAAAAQLPELETLAILVNLDAAGSEALSYGLARKGVWQQLKMLSLSNLTVTGMRALAAADLPSMEELSLSDERPDHGPQGHQFNGAAAAVAAAAHAFDALQQQQQQAPKLAALLTDAAWARRVRHLHFFQCDFTARDLEPLQRIELPCLVKLEIYGDNMSTDVYPECDAAAAAVAAVPIQNLPALRCFNMSSNRLSDAGVAALCRAPWLPQLTELSVNHNRACGDGAAAAVAAAQLRDVQRVNVMFWRGMTGAGVAALAHAAWLRRVTYVEFMVHARGPEDVAGLRAFAAAPLAGLRGLHVWARGGLAVDAVIELEGAEWLRKLIGLTLTVQPSKLAACKGLQRRLSSMPGLERLGARVVYDIRNPRGDHYKEPL